jgi:hypothetical protein
MSNHLRVDTVYEIKSPLVIALDAINELSGWTSILGNPMDPSLCCFSEATLESQQVQ